jgi:hypothetical protein
VQQAGRRVPKNPDLMRMFVEREILIKLAGPVAEHMFLGRHVGRKTDDVEAEELAKALHSDSQRITASFRAA